MSNSQAESMDALERRVFERYIRDEGLPDVVCDDLVIEGPFGNPPFYVRTIVCHPHLDSMRLRDNSYRLIYADGNYPLPYGDGYYHYDDNELPF